MQPRIALVSEDSISDFPKRGEVVYCSYMPKSVTIYSTPVCHYCHAAKEFFSENNVAFEEINVAADQDKRQEMIEMTGQMGVPVIRIGDDVVVGFDEDKIKELLAE
jgi:glutaredoxin-like YruB-family protein